MIDFPPISQKAPGEIGAEGLAVYTLNKSNTTKQIPLK
jgi:hypothetical protein